jgi:hypothetical protein
VPQVRRLLPRLEENLASGWLASCGWSQMVDLVERELEPGRIERSRR